MVGALREILFEENIDNSTMITTDATYSGMIIVPCIVRVAQSTREINQHIPMSPPMKMEDMLDQIEVFFLQ